MCSVQKAPLALVANLLNEMLCNKCAAIHKLFELREIHLNGNVLLSNNALHAVYVLSAGCNGMDNCYASHFNIFEAAGDGAEELLVFSRHREGVEGNFQLSPFNQTPPELMFR